MSTSTYGQENNLHHHCITDKDWYITYLLTFSFIKSKYMGPKLKGYRTCQNFI